MSNNENIEIILGPPAFGSPDVETLGYAMLPELNIDSEASDSPKPEAKESKTTEVEATKVAETEEVKNDKSEKADKEGK